MLTVLLTTLLLAVTPVSAPANSASTATVAPATIINVEPLCI